MRERVLKYLSYGLGAFLLVRQRRMDAESPAERPSRPRPVQPAPERPVQPGEERVAEVRDAKAAVPKSTKPLDLVKQTWNGFSDDDCTTMGAAIAYASVFSLAPLLLTVVSVAGLIFGRQAVQNNIYQQVQGLIGSGAADQVKTMLANQSQNHS